MGFIYGLYHPSTLLGKSWLSGTSQVLSKKKILDHFRPISCSCCRKLALKYLLENCSGLSNLSCDCTLQSLHNSHFVLGRLSQTSNPLPLPSAHIFASKEFQELLWKLLPNFSSLLRESIPRPRVFREIQSGYYSKGCWKQPLKIDCENIEIWCVSLETRPGTLLFAGLHDHGSYTHCRCSRNNRYSKTTAWTR